MNFSKWSRACLLVQGLVPWAAVFIACSDDPAPRPCEGGQDPSCVIVPDGTCPEVRPDHCNEDEVSYQCEGGAPAPQCRFLGDCAPSVGQYCCPIDNLP